MFQVKMFVPLYKLLIRNDFRQLESSIAFDKERNKEFSNMTHWMKKPCNQLKNCKCTILLCVIFYIFVCLFGNIVTGVFIYYLRYKEEDYENVQKMAETILESLDMSQNKHFDFVNNTFDLDDILSSLEEDAQEISDSFGSISIDNENYVRAYRI